MFNTITQKISDLANKYPKTSCLILGSFAALAMAPTFYWPILLISLTGLVLIMGRLESPWQGAWCTFIFGMGFFTFGLYWIANALLIKIEQYWWVIGFSVIGLPLLLTICWFIAGYLTVRLSKPKTLARSVLFITLLSLAEYGRAFNLTGFPWNLFGYTWGFNLPMMQTASLGGAYFVTFLTILWMATPALAWRVRARRNIMIGVLTVSIGSLLAAYTHGYMRLQSHPTVLRNDFAVTIVQPNISQDEKWETDKTLEHFLKHVDLARDGMDHFDAPASITKMAIVWPETSLEERLIMSVPDAPRALLSAMQGRAYKTALVSGMWREEPNTSNPQMPRYFNSVASISVEDGKLKLDGLYDKHHLVPFGEFLPMEQLLNLTPLVGFAGFQWGSGPRVIESSVVPPVAPMICFEAIFPWYAAAKGSEWIVNTSNDGWYGDTPGPYQHLTMTRFRAVEQGKPIARATTTGVSALIDSYGRNVKILPYLTTGTIVSAMPEVSSEPTVYSILGEGLFFLILLIGAGIYGFLRLKDI